VELFPLCVHSAELGKKHLQHVCLVTMWVSGYCCY